MPFVRSVLLAIAPAAALAEPLLATAILSAALTEVPLTTATLAKAEGRPAAAGVATTALTETESPPAAPALTEAHPWPPAAVALARVAAVAEGLTATAAASVGKRQ